MNKYRVVEKKYEGRTEFFPEVSVSIGCDNYKTIYCKEVLLTLKEAEEIIRNYHKITYFEKIIHEVKID